MDLLASNLVWFLLYGLTKIAPIISVYLLFTFPWPVLYLSLHIFFFVSSITLLLKDREKSHSLPPSKRSYRQELNWNFNSNLFIIPSVNIVHAITNRSYMTLNAKRIPIKQWSPIKQRTHKQYQRALPSQSWFKIILYCIFLLLLLFNTNPMYSATITYIPPETNHILTQEASLDLPRQHNILQTVIRNNICPHPFAPSVPDEKGSPTNCYCRDQKCNSAFWNSSLDNSATGNPDISNPTNGIQYTPHSFIADTPFMDTIAYQVIFTDKTLLTSFIATKGKFKGVGTFRLDLSPKNSTTLYTYTKQY